jgi:hypothetical protein
VALGLGPRLAELAPDLDQLLGRGLEAHPPLDKGPEGGLVLGARVRAEPAGAAVVALEPVRDDDERVGQRREAVGALDGLRRGAEDVVYVDYGPGWR